MPATMETVRIACPICGQDHDYRVRVQRRGINDNMFCLFSRKHPGDRAFRTALVCQRSGDRFHTELCLYEMLEEEIEAIEIVDARRAGISGRVRTALSGARLLPSPTRRRSEDYMRRLDRQGR